MPAKNVPQRVEKVPPKVEKAPPKVVPKVEKVTYKVPVSRPQPVERAQPVERKEMDLRLTQNSQNKLVTTDAPPERKTFK